MHCIRRFGCTVVNDERAGATAGAGREVDDAARGRVIGRGLYLRRELRAAVKEGQALPGASESLQQDGVPGQLRHVIAVAEQSAGSRRLFCGQAP